MNIALTAGETMTDVDDFQFRGPVIGRCGTCLAPIHAGPNEYSVVYSCEHAKWPTLPLMFSQERPNEQR